MLIKKATHLLPIATNHDTVEALIDVADQLAKTNKNPHQSVHILIIKGQNEYYSSNYEDAVAIYYQALEQAEQLHDSILLAKVTLNLGMVYDELEDYDEAINFFHKALTISQSIKDSSVIAKTYQNIAISYQNKKDLAKALEYNEKANELAILKKDTTMIIDVINNFGTIAYDQKNLVKSLDYYSKALNLYQKIKDRKGIAMAYNNIGLVYLDKNEYEKSIDYFNKSLALATELKMHGFIGDIYSNLTIYYQQKKDFKKAFYCYDRFNAIYDSLAGEKKNKMIYQIQAKYKLGRNTRELEELKVKNRSQLNAIDSAKSSQFYWVAITVLVMVLMCATVYLLYKEKELANELKNKTKELYELNVSKDKFFSIIAHDLKNPFNVLVSYTGILKTDLELFSKEELEQIISDLNEASENGYNLLQNLLIWTRSQTNRIHILKTNFVLADIFNDVKGLAELNLTNKEQTLSVEIDQNLGVYADKDMISVVLRNLVFNAIKFSVKGSVIYLNASLVGSNVRIDVVDSGIGISEESIKKLFTLDKNTMTHGTEGETGTGLGLVLCKEFVEKNDGTIWVESKLGKGSVFSFTIPAERA
ncbi:tetratricopeptide repeat-containing sensor histidine kinase [Aquipluma nitroreducens]|uniref:tetratricopeptide repeat-containing sensor histidine kinase n=1 Tax=Aquipluma nitroreducens TaxID=2010828 RepID=UPI00296FEE12|nr:tetratricopeptide repeat-containing sensor histidine kinase [Aquipluma nitroreducens]